MTNDEKAALQIIRAADPAERQRARDRADEISRRINIDAMNSLAKRALNEKFPSKTIEWLWKLADILSKAADGTAACKAGCNHCCHIPLTLSSMEAVQIAKKTGATLHMPKKWKFTGDQSFVGTPCPFLKEGQCSIYSHRPFACRVHYSLADDALPCELVSSDNATKTVPYVDVRQHNEVYVRATRDVQFADIRDFFK